MKFEESMTAKTKLIAKSAEKVWGMWEILWETSSENARYESVQFLAENGGTYCIASLNAEIDGMDWLRDEPPQITPTALKKQSIFFDNLEELIKYGKYIKKKYKIEQKIHAPKKHLLLAIKKEFLKHQDEIEYATKHQHRLSRVD